MEYSGILARYFLFFIITSTLIYYNHGQTIVSDILINVELGEIRGEKVDYGGNNIDRYLGIPYAMPPVGERRFKPPEQPNDWMSQSLDTRQYKPGCYQNTTFFGGLDSVDEDCLYLNVYVPEGANHFPVMVWIHGGGFTTGAGSQTHPEAMAIVGDVIIVTINYRLNVFGFLATKEGTIGGNAGLMDQVMALEWVKTNIKLFGGDVNKITVFGQNAGSWSVSLHLISPMSQGLFQRAICQSGAMDGVHQVSREERGSFTELIAGDAQCDVEDESTMVTCLQALAAADLFQHFESRYTGETLAIIDGTFLPWTPAVYYDTVGKDPEYFVDVMMGINSDEGLLFFMGGFTDDFLNSSYITNGLSKNDTLFSYLPMYLLQNVMKSSKPMENDPLWRLMKDFYLQDLNNPIANVRGQLDMAGQFYFFGPTMRTIKKVASTGQKAYLYYFDQTIPAQEEKFGHKLADGSVRYWFPTVDENLPLGAPHGQDLFFTFGQVSETIDPDNSYYNNVNAEAREVGKAMVHAWTTFARTGSPEYAMSTGTSIPWPRYDLADEIYLELKGPMTPESVKSRLLPAASTFHTELIPQFVNKLEEKGEDPDQFQSTPNKGTGDVASTKCEKEKNVSTLSGTKAETALFILCAVVFVLFLATGLMVMNYFTLKKELRNAQAYSKQKENPAFEME